AAPAREGTALRDPEEGRARGLPARARRALRAPGLPGGGGRRSDRRRRLLRGRLHGVPRLGERSRAREPPSRDALRDGHGLLLRRGLRRRGPGAHRARQARPPLRGARHAGDAVSAARERARTFVALPLGPQLGSIVAARCAPLLDEQRFRRPRAEGLHLTLHFLGDVAREALHPLAASLRSSLAGVLAPALRLRGAGAFPDARDARVLWVGVEERAHPGRLAACRHAVLEGLSRAGIDTREEAER